MSEFSIVQLFERIGAENITFQNLNQSGLSKVKKGKVDARVTFYTSTENGNALMRAAAGITSDKVCFVVWLPKKKCDEIYAEITSKEGK